jgi:Mn-dependent DtxR family transcriptional regulator
MTRQHVRKPNDTITKASERILELLKNNEPLPVGAITEELSGINNELAYSTSTVSRATTTLAENSLIEEHYGNYSITQKGEDFLHGRIDLTDNKVDQ